MRAIGSTNIISTGYGSTRRKQFSIDRKIIFSPPSLGRCAQRGRGRITFVVAENEPQQARLARPAERGGYGLDALWNDDFHHSAMVALTGRHEAYYSDYRGRPREFVAAAKHGFLYQGQRYQWQQKARGTPDARPPGGMFCRLSAEPRSDRQLRHRRALSRVDEPRSASRHDRLFPADAGNSDAVPGAGIRRV